ncbi:DUF1667 domain-containing protein [Caproicibacter fermentans]|uniref:DUF1667 domain-containing protein n=1 Tax=Caproicibacter fermentans TaxID=2576756 RepID=A0A7G8TBN8_9FIRM|nr:DUF1667 domain-containing protein [Caproicibacter fermentans]QNK41029.1 DUF1667 domain-containing protein [Caproicibacter fermentans]
MLKKFVCIICPNGCEISAELEEGRIISVQGAGCSRGQEYVRQELINPVRNIASSVLLEGGALPLASVRLSNPVPKSRIFDVMDEIKKAKLTAPVSIGQTVIHNVLGLGSDVIVTKNISAH